MRRSRWHTVEYVVLLAGSLVLALIASWTFGGQIDKDAYDWNFRRYQPADWEPQTVLLAIDEESYQVSGGVDGLRESIAKGLDLIAKAKPKARWQSWNGS